MPQECRKGLEVARFRGKTEHFSERRTGKMLFKGAAGREIPLTEW